MIKPFFGDGIHDRGSSEVSNLWEDEPHFPGWPAGSLTPSHSLPGALDSLGHPPSSGSLNMPCYYAPENPGPGLVNLCFTFVNSFLYFLDKVDRSLSVGPTTCPLYLCYSFISLSPLGASEQLEGRGRFLCICVLMLVERMNERIR